MNKAIYRFGLILTGSVLVRPPKYSRNRKPGRGGEFQEGLLLYFFACVTLAIAVISSL